MAPDDSGVDMAMIKSALELALERTKDIKVDDSASEANELRIEGKKAAGRYVEDPENQNLGSLLSSYPKEKRKNIQEGMFDTLVSQLQLPTNEASIAKLEVLGKGMAALASANAGGLLGGVGSAMSEKKVQALFDQLAGFFRQYLNDMKNVEQVIRKQWGPKLREKEREMSARLGQEVRLDPMADQEFAAFYKQNVGAARAQYQTALDRAKTDLAGILGIEDRG
jgi:hypothetical protein